MTQHPWEQNNGSQQPAHQNPQAAPQQYSHDSSYQYENLQNQNSTYQGQQYADATEEFPSQQQNPQGFYQEAQQPEQPASKGATKVVVTAALVAALVGGGVGAGVATVVAHQNSSSVTSTGATVSGTTIVNNTDSVNEVTAAAAKATPSVVTISVVGGSSSSGSGSGIVLDDQGHILTNTHVVTLDGQTSNPSIEVQLSDGTVRTAKLVGTDPASDLAVIKIDTAGVNITPASLGDSSKLNVGDISIAIGAPLGLENTVTDGIISNLSRTIEVASSAAPEDSDSSSSDSGNSNQSPFQFEVPGQNQQRSSTQSTIALNVLQTDAAVNPGNSGGALVNAQGEVIGVNVAIASTDSSSGTAGNIGVGFSIPINYAKRVAQDLISNGSASHGLLGASVSTSPANNDSSEIFGDGALVQSVVNGGAAAQAGLQKGDVVTSLNGRSVRSSAELTATVRENAPGTKVEITYLRNGQERTAEVTLADSAQ